MTVCQFNYAYMESGCLLSIDIHLNLDHPLERWVARELNIIAGHRRSFNHIRKRRAQNLVEPLRKAAGDTWVVGGAKGQHNARAISNQTTHLLRDRLAYPVGLGRVAVQEALHADAKLKCIRVLL